MDAKPRKRHHFPPPKGWLIRGEATARLSKQERRKQERTNPKVLSAKMGS